MHVQSTRLTLEADLDRLIGEELHRPEAAAEVAITALACVTHITLTRAPPALLARQVLTLVGSHHLDNQWQPCILHQALLLII